MPTFPSIRKDPVDRLSRILAAAQCRIVLGDRICFERLAGEKAGGFPVVDSQWISVAEIPPLHEDVEEVVCPPDGERLAYILFTSGSTGVPKAVEIEHRHAANLLRSAQVLLGFGPSDRYLAASTIAFDSSITELFLPLVTGASLLLRDPGILLEPAQLADDVRAFGVTLLQTGPSIWSVILANVPDFPKLRVAITHGEAVSPALARRLCAYADEAWNLYGPTETTVWATGFRLTPDLVLDPSEFSAPIGRPLAHLEARVLNEADAEAEDGAPGELVLVGSSVARGYRNVADQVEDRFVVIDGVRAYRTGDVVFRDAQSVIHYLGRNDEQMKVRGIRVEPGEVEAAVLRHPGIAQAAVTWYPTPSGSRAIVAAIIAKPGRKVLGGRPASPFVDDLAAGDDADPLHVCPVAAGDAGREDRQERGAKCGGERRGRARAGGGSGARPFPDRGDDRRDLAPDAAPRECRRRRSFFFDRRRFIVRRGDDD